MSWPWPALAPRATPTYATANEALVDEIQVPPPPPNNEGQWMARSEVAKSWRQSKLTWSVAFNGARTKVVALATKAAASRRGDARGATAKPKRTPSVSLAFKSSPDRILITVTVHNPHRSIARFDASVQQWPICF